MSRWKRKLPDGVAQHVVNRGAKRALLFHQPVDCSDFLERMADARERFPVSVIAFSLMKNHWHLLVLPERGVALSAYMQWLMNAHTRQYRARYGGRGEGHIYQGPYRNSPAPTAGDIRRARVYIEANALRARFVQRAEDWPWSSLHTARAPSGRLILADPSPPSLEWIERVNRGLPESSLERIRRRFAGRRTGRPGKWADVAVP